MKRILDLSQLGIDQPFSVEATPEDCQIIKSQFEFDDVQSVIGTFMLTNDVSVVPCLLLRGDIQANVMVEGMEFKMEVPMELYLVKNEDDIEKFELENDVEVLENNMIDIGDIISQYMYLFLLNSDDEFDDEEEEEV